jgi:Domain of unknown function (DUF1707)
MRASDADREAAADLLRDAHAEGRLTMDEFGERIDRSLSAKTLGELAVITQDLPEARRADVAVPRRFEGARHLRGIWGAWASAALLGTVIWGASSLTDGDPGVHAFWPIWVIGPWGAVLLARTLFGAERERPGRQDGERDHR